MPIPMSQAQLETMALRWAKQYRPGLLPELAAESLTACQEWARERAEAVLNDWANQAQAIETSGLTEPEQNQRRRSLWEMLLEGHFPVTSGGPESLNLPPEGVRRLEADHQRTIRREMEEFGQTREQAEATWEAIKPQAAMYLLEDLERERMGLT